MITILCVGKTKENWLQQGIDEYQKRLDRVWKVKWRFIDDISIKAAGNFTRVKEKEAEVIQKNLQIESYLIALDEQGNKLDSRTFSSIMADLIPQKDITFIIGGVYGLHDDILKKADMVISFSPLTFTHQIIRLLLIEQLYRCWTIQSGKSYHY